MFWLFEFVGKDMYILLLCNDNHEKYYQNVR